MGTKGAWTPERRTRQAEIIRSTKPWERSSGPRTEAGKAISSQNARSADWLVEATARRAVLRAAVLDLFDRKRMPSLGRRRRSQ